MNPAALPDAALQLPADRLGQADVSITDNELDARKATLLEGGDEFAPEALGLAVAHLDAQPALEVGGIQVDVGVARLL